MNSYKKTLRKIISAYDSEKFLFLPDNRFPDEDVKFLQAKGLIDLVRYGDDIFYIVLSNPGRTFFYDRRAIWINRIGGFIAGVLSTVIAGAISGALSQVLPFLR